jgi:dTDP-4-dehydrorhamnose reductase
MNILLLGKDGQVGWELQRALAPLGTLTSCGRKEADLDKLDALRETVRRVQPDIIVNSAAYTAVDKAESDIRAAQRINSEAAGLLAEEAHRRNTWLVHYSTDYVFDGTSDAPYQEDHPANPLSVYGKTKYEGEERIRQSQAKHLIFRTSWVHAARGNNFVKTMLRLAKERDELKVINDQHGAPTSAELIADVTALALHQLLSMPDGAALSGTYHLTAGGYTTWYDYARYVLELAQAHGITLKTSSDAVWPIPAEAYPLPATRPRNSRLDTSKLTNTFHLQLPDWRHHVQRLMDELAAQGTP